MKYDKYDESKITPEDILIFQDGKRMNLMMYKLHHPFKSLFLNEKKIKDIRMGRIDS